MGIIQELADLRGTVDALARAVGRHQRVPEQRWGVVTTCTISEIRVTFPGESGDCIITRSTEAVWVGAQVLVQVQGSDRWITGLSGATIPAGTVAWFAGPTIPPGWLLCNGQGISRSTYWRLFAVLGTTYGAPDANTFQVPNLQDRMAVGAGGAYSRSATGGSATHVLTVDEMPAHNHGAIGWPQNATAGSHLNSDWGTSGWPKVDPDQNKGGGQPHNNMPPYLALFGMVKF